MNYHHWTYMWQLCRDGAFELYPKQHIVVKITITTICSTKSAVRPWVVGSGGTKDMKLKLQINKEWKTQISTERTFWGTRSKKFPLRTRNAKLKSLIIKKQKKKMAKEWSNAKSIPGPQPSDQWKFNRIWSENTSYVRKISSFKDLKLSTQVCCYYLFKFFFFIIVKVFFERPISQLLVF